MRAHHLLRTATHVLSDGLISREILALVHPSAEITPVGKRCGRPGITQEEINALVCSLARAGGAVVRLKSGDPLVFGRAGEEIAALRENAIPFEVVPGITAAFAAAAAIEAPLTDRASASKLILATAHHAVRDEARKPRLIWEGPLPADATVVFYMPGPNPEELAAHLVREGSDGTTPVITVSRISASDQRVTRSTLATLWNEECGPAPLLFMVGRSLQKDSVE